MDMLAQGIAHVFFGLGGDQHLKKCKNRSCKLRSFHRHSETSLSSPLRFTYMKMKKYATYSNKTGKKSYSPILRYDIWVIQVGIWVIWDFFILHTGTCILMCLLSSPCNFWLFFKQFCTKTSEFSAACQIQNYRKLENFNLQSTRTVLHWYAK